MELTIRRGKTRVEREKKFFNKRQLSYLKKGYLLFGYLAT